MDFEYTQENMITIASGYESALGDSSVSDAYFTQSSDGLWSHKDDLGFEIIEQLANNAGFHDPKDARDWLTCEAQDHREDGNDHLADMYLELLKPDVEIEECIIVGKSSDGSHWLWDGTHRIAAAYASNKVVSGIIGELINS
ncbi:hypothetical protein VCHA53O466_140137 [Vibrio chagasii]|nr:hypothetical protein VCHA53O466_140137 [Vibrio chagasii]